MLNPEFLDLRRRAGVQALSLGGGKLTSSPLCDNPLLLTGGGTTVLDLKLLFDIRLPGSLPDVVDVRRHTEPLWRLSETTERGGLAPYVLFIWGKAWKICAVVAAISERLDRFSVEGVPERSWVELRLVRVQRDAQVTETAPRLPPHGAHENLHELDSYQYVRLPHSGDSESATPRWDLLAFETLGDATQWRSILELNAVHTPTQVPSGTLVRVPNLRGFTRASG